MRLLKIYKRGVENKKLGISALSDGKSVFHLSGAISVFYTWVRNNYVIVNNVKSRYYTLYIESSFFQIPYL